MISMLSASSARCSRTSRLATSFARQHRGAHAAVCAALGERLVYQKSWEVQKPGKGELRIQVAAAGVNFADLLKTRGQYQEKADPPFVVRSRCSDTTGSFFLS